MLLYNAIFYYSNADLNTLLQYINVYTDWLARHVDIWEAVRSEELVICAFVLKINLSLFHLKTQTYHYWLLDRMGVLLSIS